MAPRPRLSLPTAAPLPHSHRLPADNPSVFKTLNKLSRPSLLVLVQQWLHQPDQSLCSPCLLREGAGDDDTLDEDVYPMAQDIEELKEIYQKFQERKGGKREVIDRILEGDWRHGVTLYQLATADLRYLLEHNSSQKWSAMKLSMIVDQENKPVGEMKETAEVFLPRFHAATFLQNLHYEVAPLVKAHYYLARVKPLALAILRVYIHDSPYNSQRSLADPTNGTQALGDGSKVLYVAFPDNSPMLYISLISAPGQSAGAEGRNLRRMVVEALPKAFSRSRARYTLEPTSLTARSLSALIALRGPGRGNNAAGGWSIFAEGSVEDSPLDPVEPSMREKVEEEKPEEESADTVGENDDVAQHSAESSPEEPPIADEVTKKRRIEVAEGRFGHAALEGDGKGIERLDIRLKDAVPSGSLASSAQLADQSFEHSLNPETWTPQVQLTFQGSHVFAGIRRLIETGVVDGEAMPSWMTGEAGVSVGIVHDGKIKGDQNTSA